MMKPQAGNNTSVRLLVRGRRVILLVILVLLLAIAILFQWNGGPSPVPKSPANRGTVRSPESVRNSVDSEDPGVFLEELRQSQLEYEKGKRNLFAFHVPPPPPPPPEQVQVLEAVQPVCGDQICQPSENYQSCPGDCQPPPPPDIALRYIGYMQEEDGSVAFLTDGKEVFMGRVNDIIANKYRILKISNDSLELGYLNLNQSKTIRFQGSNQS